MDGQDRQETVTRDVREERARSAGKKKGEVYLSYKQAGTFLGMNDYNMTKLARHGVIKATGNGARDPHGVRYRIPLTHLMKLKEKKDRGEPLLPRKTPAIIRDEEGRKVWARTGSLVGRPRKASGRPQEARSRGESMGGSQEGGIEAQKGSGKVWGTAALFARVNLLLDQVGTLQAQVSALDHTNRTMLGVLARLSQPTAPSTPLAGDNGSPADGSER